MSNARRQPAGNTSGIRLTGHRDAEARFIGRMMLLGGVWSSLGVELLIDKNLVAEIANLQNEDLITTATVQNILIRYGYPQDNQQVTSWLSENATAGDPTHG